MTTLLVLGFPYPTTAEAAAQDILLQEPELSGHARRGRRRHP